MDDSVIVNKSQTREFQLSDSHVWRAKQGSMTEPLEVDNKMSDLAKMLKLYQS